MSDKEIPTVIKLILPNGGELKAEWAKNGPDHTSSEYIIRCEGKDDIFRSFVETFPWSMQKEGLRYTIRRRATDPLFMPFMGIGDEEPPPISSTINLNERRAIAILVQSRAEDYGINNVAKRARDMCHRCKQTFHQFEHLAPFPDFCAAIRQVSPLCANCIWVTTRDQDEDGVDDDVLCGISTH